MLTQDPQNFLTEPLALQFMTQGQMGYMPAAQYLTPAEYGAFRTIPNAQGHNYLNQDLGMLQSFLIRNRGSILGLPAYTWNTYNPAVNLQQYMYRMHTQSNDGLAAGAGVLADLVAGTIAGGMIGGIPGLAAGMLMPSVSRPFIDRVRDLRAIQNMSMSKIVAGADVNAITGTGFNGASARNIDSFLRLQSSGDALMKEGDWRKLLQMGIEHGQFDYAGNAEQYKDALKKLRKSITTVMEVAGSTDFKDILKEYKRMQTMGADLSQYTSIMRKEDLYGRITGMSHTNMVNTFGQQGAVIYQQAGLTGYQGSLQAMHNAAQITLMQRSGLITPGTLSRYGGISGMAQTMTEQGAGAQNILSDFMLPYFMNEDASGLDPSASFSKLLNSSDPLGLMARSAGSKVRSPQQMMRFQHNKGKLMQEFQERYGQELPEAVTALSIGHQTGLKGTQALEFGYRQLGYDQNMAYFKAVNFSSKEFREQEERELQLARRKQREERDMAESPFRKLALALDKMFTRTGEVLFGGMAREYANWNEKNIAHNEGLYDGASPIQNKAYRDLQKEAAYGAEHGGNASDLPAPNIISDLNELSDPAAQVISGGDAAKIAWKKSGGTAYGLFGLTEESEKENGFVAWLKKRGGKYAEMGKKLEEAGGLKDFGSQEESEKSQVAAVWQELAKDDEFNKAQREYVKDTKYNPSLAAMTAEERAQTLASPILQKILYQEAAEGKIRKVAAAAEGAQGSRAYFKLPKGWEEENGLSARNLSAYNVGNVTADDKGNYEAYADYYSGLLGTGIKALRYTDTVRTFKMKQADGSLREMKKKAETLHEFSSIYEPWNAKNDPKNTNNPTQKAKGIAAEIKKHTGRDIGIDEKINFRDKDILAALIKAIPLREHGKFVYDFITYEDADAAAADLLAGKKPVIVGNAPRKGERYVFPTTTGGTPSQSEAPAQASESQQPRADADNLRAAISEKIASATKNAIARGVEYGRKNNSDGTPQYSNCGNVDCSAWVNELVVNTLPQINREAGEDVFSEQFINDFKGWYVSGTIIDKMLAQIGGAPLREKDLTEDKIKAGMIIGVDAEPNKGSGTYGIDHVLMPFFDPVTQQWMISDSSPYNKNGHNNKKGGVAATPYKKWYERQIKLGRKVYAVDLLSRAKGGASPGTASSPLRTTTQSSATDLIRNLMAQTGKGAAIQEVVKAWAKSEREKAGSDEARVKRIDEMEKRLLDTAKTEDKKIDEQQQKESAWKHDVVEAERLMSGEFSAAIEQLQQSWWSPKDTVSPSQISQILGREQSGIDLLQDGTVNYTGLAGLLTDDDKKARSLAITIRNNMEKQASESNLKKMLSNSKVEEYVKSILENSELNPDEIKAALDNDIFRAAISASSIHVLKRKNDDAAKNVLTSLTNAHEKAIEDRNKVDQPKIEKKVDEKFDAAFKALFPYAGSLDGQYEKDIDYLKHRTFKDTDSTPMLMMATRLTALKRLATRPDADPRFKAQFIEEAKKYKFDEKWIKEQLEGKNAANDITIKQFQQSADFRELKAEDFDPVRKLGIAFSELWGMHDKKGFKVIDEYKEHFSRPEAVIPDELSTTLAAADMAEAARLAARIGIPLTELRTPEGIKKAHKKVVEHKISGKRDIEIIEEVWKKSKGGTISLPYSDFVPRTYSSKTSIDKGTWAEINTPNLITAASARANAEDTAAANALPQAQSASQSSQNGAKAQSGSDSPLKDSTVEELNNVLKDLAGVLKQWRSDPPKVRIGG